LPIGIGIKLEGELPGVDPNRLSGEAVARAQHDLHRLAEELELRPLGEFVSFSRAEREALAIDMGFGEGAVARSSESWFPAAEGLEVVRGLLRYLEANPGELVETAEVVAELQAMERVLIASSEHQVRFHLSVDY